MKTFLDIFKLYMKYIDEYDDSDFEYTDESDEEFILHEEDLTSEEEEY